MPAKRDSCINLLTVTADANHGHSGTRQKRREQPTSKPVNVSAVEKVGKTVLEVK